MQLPQCAAKTDATLGIASETRCTRSKAAEAAAEAAAKEAAAAAVDAATDTTQPKSHLH